jgi:hypothetical protein
MRTNNETHMWALALVMTISAGCVSTPKATEEKPDSALVLSVEGNFEKYCSKCHGLDGKGDTPLRAETWREGLRQRRSPSQVER